jgi:hypothetical protein
MKRRRWVRPGLVDGEEKKINAEGAEDTASGEDEKRDGGAKNGGAQVRERSGGWLG